MTSAVMPFSATGPLGRQWLAVASASDIADGPAGIRLLGQSLVLYRSPNRLIVAAPDRCPHSKGDLTKGEVNDGLLACPKHGWTFGDEGRCVFKPSGLPIADKAHLKTYACTERYGLIWVSIGDPAGPIMNLEWDGDERYRRIHSEMSVWQSNAMHIIETFLAQTDSPTVDVTADVPFTAHVAFKTADGTQHRRLLSCAPADGRKSMVTAVLWTTSAPDRDGEIVDAAMADLNELKSTAESAVGPSSTGEIVVDEQDTNVADWKRRLLDFVGQGVA